VFFFWPKIRHSAKNKNGYEDPKAKISENPENSPVFEEFFWDSPVLDNQSYLVASM
jgi:hypothetical protein